MFSTSSERIIVSLVSMVLDEPGMRMPELLEPSILHYNTGVLFDLTFETYDDSLEFPAREETKAMRHYYLACCGNTSVFVVSRERTDGELGLRSIHNIEPDEWINLGNHDSCWRDSIRGWMNVVCGGMCEKVDPNKAPRTLTSEAQIGFTRPYILVEMSTKSDDTKDSSYWRKVNHIKFK